MFDKESVNPAERAGTLELDNGTESALQTEGAEGLDRRAAEAAHDDGGQAKRYLYAANAAESKKRTSDLIGRRFRHRCRYSCWFHHQCSKPAGDSQGSSRGRSVPRCLTS